jgi:flavodoxin
MSEVIVAFWTGTGNTAEMAEYVAEGIKEGGAEAKVVSVDDISAADLKDAKAFALGCPSMGVEQLEESTMEPFVEEVRIRFRKNNRIIRILRMGRRRMDEKLGRADGRSRSNCCWRRRRNLSGSSR